METRRKRMMRKKEVTPLPSDTPEVIAEKKQLKAKKEVKKKVRAHLQKYANLYVKKKEEIIPLMSKALGEPIPPDATHGELISTYIKLLHTNPEFEAQARKMIDEYKLAVDPVSAIAEAIGAVAGTVGTFKAGSNVKAQAEAEQDAMLYSMILSSQKKDNTTTIVIVSVVSLIAVGGLIYFISRKK